MSYDNYQNQLLAKAQCDVQMAGQARPQTVTERLEWRRDNLTAELDRVNKAIAALKSNPGVEEVMNLVSQAGY